MLSENRAEQDRLDAKAAEKKGQEAQVEKKEDESADIKKFAENRRRLSKLQKQLEQIIKPDLSAQAKVNAAIIEEINKPRPIT